MSVRDLGAPPPDVIVIGSGPNGLVAACRLAEAGFGVRVLEAHPNRPGGAVGSVQSTLPGFVHDVGAAFFPFARLSPAFQALKLDEVGLRWAFAEIESAHPAPDGTVAALARDDDLSAQLFGADGDRWRKRVRWFRRACDRLMPVLLGPVGDLGPVLRANPLDLARFAAVAVSTGAGLSRRWFRTEAARRVIPGLALHVDVGPDDRFGAALGTMLAFTGAVGGYGVPVGGAQALADALVRRLESFGGRVHLGERVAQIQVSGGRAVGVVTASGQVIPARHAVMANTDVGALYLKLLAPEHVPTGLVRRMSRFNRGWGTFKVDWALDGPAPWASEVAARSAVVHAGDSLADLSRFTREVRGGALPEHPYLVIGQQSLADPSRAPEGRHTLWAYSRVPPQVEGGWAAAAEAFADRIEARIEGLAPGFRQRVLARSIVTPRDLEAMDANLVGGDLGGGSSAWHNQLVFRPAFPWFRYRTPVKRLYLCSSYAHPGAGVHGMCGWNAAGQAIRDRA